MRIWPFIAGSLGVSTCTISLTWMVLFVWKIGYEGISSSSMRIHSEGFPVLLLTTWALICCIYLMLWIFTPRISTMKKRPWMAYSSVLILFLGDLIWDGQQLLIHFHYV